MEAKSANLPSPKQSRMQRHRTNVLQEILSTERTYVNNLVTVLEVYLTPIREKAVSPSAILSVSDFSKIFSNWEVLLNLHSAVLSEIEKMVSSPVSVFASYLEYFAIYTLYVNNYGRALSTLNRVSQIPRVQAFFKQCKNHLMCNNLDLASFLIMPVQRVPRYELLFKDLLKHTNPQHEDYALLTETLEQIGKIAVNINERKRDAEQLDRVVAVAEMFNQELRTNELSDLVQEHRRVVREGPLYRISRRHAGKRLERHGILFNDLLLITSWRGHGQLELHSFHALNSVTLRDLTDASSVRNAFSVDIDDHPDGGVTVSFASPEEKESWFADLKKWIEDCEDREYAKTGELFAWEYGEAQDYYAEPRYAHTLTAVGDTVLLFGGADLDENVYSDLYLLDTNTNQWSAPVFEGAQTSPRHYHSAVAVGDPTTYDSQLIIFGGYDGTNRLNDLWILDTNLLAWSYIDVGENAPLPRSAHSAAAVGHKMYVFGGRGSDGQFLSDLIVFDVDAKTWSWPEIAGASPDARAWHSATTVGTDIYIFGGYATNKTYNDMWILDTIRMEWRCISTGVAGRYAHVAVLIGRRLFVVGGAHAGIDFSEDVAVFDTDSNLWSYPRLRTSTGPVAFHGMAGVGNKLVIFGGKTDMSSMTTGDPLYLNARAMSVGEMFGELRWQAEGKLAKTKLMSDHGDACDPILKQWAISLHRREEEEIYNAEAAALAQKQANAASMEENEEFDVPGQLRRAVSEYQKPSQRAALATTRTKSAKLFVSPEDRKVMKGQRKGVFSTIKQRLTTKEQPKMIKEETPAVDQEVKDSRRVTIDETKRITFEAELSKALKRRTTKPPSSDLRNLSTEIAKFDQKNTKQQESKASWTPNFNGTKTPIRSEKKEKRPVAEMVKDDSRPPSMIVKSEEEEEGEVIEPVQTETEVTPTIPAKTEPMGTPVSPPAEKKKEEAPTSIMKPLTMAERMKREHRFRPGSRMPSSLPPQLRPRRATHQRILSKVIVPPSSGTLLSQQHLDLSHKPGTIQAGRLACPAEVQAKLYRGDDIRVVPLKLLAAPSGHQSSAISPRHGKTRPTLFSDDDQKTLSLSRSASGHSSSPPEPTMRQRIVSEGADDGDVVRMVSPLGVTPPRLTPPVPQYDKSPASRLRKEQHRRSVSYSAVLSKKTPQVSGENSVCSVAALITRIRAFYTDFDGAAAMTDEVVFKLKFKDEEGDLRRLQTKSDLWAALAVMSKQHDKYFRLWIERVDNMKNVVMEDHRSTMFWRGKEVAKAYMDSTNFTRMKWKAGLIECTSELRDRFSMLNESHSMWNSSSGLGAVYKAHGCVSKLINTVIHTKECRVWRQTKLPVPSEPNQHLDSVRVDYVITGSTDSTAALPLPPIRCLVVIGEQGECRGDVEPVLVSAMSSALSINSDHEYVYGVLVCNVDYWFYKLGMESQKNNTESTPPNKHLPDPPNKPSRPPRKFSISSHDRKGLIVSECVRWDGGDDFGELLGYWLETVSLL